MWVRWSISTFSRSMPRGVIPSLRHSSRRASGSLSRRDNADFREPKSSNIALATSRAMSSVARSSVAMPELAGQGVQLGDVLDGVASGPALGGRGEHLEDVAAVVGVGRRAGGDRPSQVAGHDDVGVGPTHPLLRTLRRRGRCGTGPWCSCDSSPPSSSTRTGAAGRRGGPRPSRSPRRRRGRSSRGRRGGWSCRSSQWEWPRVTSSLTCCAASPHPRHAVSASGVVGATGSGRLRGLGGQHRPALAQSPRPDEVVDLSEDERVGHARLDAGRLAAAGRGA